jgi:hypothetical protein
MGLFDGLFNKQSGSGNSGIPKGGPSKDELLRQINCISTLRNSFRNSTLDNMRKARMTNNMTTFKAALVFAYDAVFKYGVARDVISSDEDFMAAANIGSTLGQMLVTGNKDQIHSVMRDTLESWESHVQAITVLSLMDSNVASSLPIVSEISKTFNYLTQF